MAVAFFGDGAVNNGAFHEGLNMAGIWKLPVLFVCENNQFATEVPFAYAAGNPSVASRGASYGMPGVEVDGNDVLAVYEAAGEAVAARPQRRRADLARMPDLPHPAARRGHGRLHLPHPRRSRGLESALPDPPLARPRSSKRADRCRRPSSRPSRRRSTRSSTTRSSSPRIQPLARPRDGDPIRLRRIHRSPAARVAEHRSRLAGSGSREISYMQATLEALAEEMARDPSIFVLGEGIGKRGGNFKTTAGLYDRYGPVRLCDTPICERGFVGLGCGAAMTGTRPVIDFMFADFVLDAVGEIINQIAKIQYMSSGRLKMPVLLRGCIGIGHSAATHHSGNYYPMYAHFPGLRVVVPSTPYDAKGLLKQALRCNDPVIFLEHRELLGVKGPVPDGDYEIDFGQAAVVREGSDVTVVALALMVHQTQKVCERLGQRRDLGRADRSADGGAARHRDDPPIGRQDRPAVDRRRGVRPLRHRRRDRRAAGRSGFRRSGCPDPPAQRCLHADSVQPDRWKPPSCPTPESIAQAIRDLMAE